MSSEAPQAAYQGPQWVYEVPKGSTIEGGTITATITAPHGQAWLATPASSYDAADVLANCQANIACGAAGSITAAFPITHTGGKNIYVTAVCVGPYEGATSCPADGGLDAAVYVSAAAIELTNNSTPAASGFAGTLLAPGARGTQELLFDASDPEGPGVYTITAQADGATLYTGTPDSNGGECLALAAGPLTFDHAQPCPESESVDLSIDTTSLPDGPHTLKLTVQDAAGNASVVYDATITTNNAPANSAPPAITTPGQAVIGAALTAQPGAWAAPAGAGPITYGYQWQDCDAEGNGCHSITGADTPGYTPTPADAGHTLRVLATAADNDGAATIASNATSVVQALSSSAPAPGSGTPSTPPVTLASTPNGVDASEDAILHITPPATLHRSFAQSAHKLAGHLTDSQSRPIADATLDVLQQTEGSNTLTLLEHAQTSPTGAFSVSVPPGPSRRIEIAYRAFNTDASYTTTATIQETVKARAQLHISWLRSTHSPTGTIIFTGNVQGPIPHQGALVQILVHWHGHWELIRNPRTNSNGHFHAEYQFQGSIGTFPFIAEIPSGQTNFPYTRGYSNAINITTG
jgi:hypothetical protein